MLDPLAGHLDHVHQLDQAIWWGSAVVGNLAQNLNSSKEITLNNVSIASVVYQVYLGQHHGELCHRGFATLHEGCQELVQVYQVTLNQGVYTVGYSWQAGTWPTFSLMESGILSAW